MPPMIRDLKVKLTDPELKNLAKQMAYEEQTHSEIEEEAKSSAKGFKLRLDASKKTISDLAEKLRSESETRAVEVYETPDTRTNTVKMYRFDNHEMINTRPMTASERMAATRPTLPGVPMETKTPADAFPDQPAAAHDGPTMKATAGDMVVTGGAGGLPEDSPALPAPTDREADPAWDGFEDGERDGNLEDRLDKALEEGDAEDAAGNVQPPAEDFGADPDPADAQREYDDEQQGKPRSNVLPMKPKRSHKKKAPKA